MRRWKATRLLWIAMVMALVAAACTTEAPSDEAIEVMWIRGADHPEGQAFLEVLAAFTAETGIEVEYNGVGDDLPTILGTRVEGEDPPDVAVIAQPGLLTTLGERGALVPASQDVIDGVAANFAQVWIDLGTVDGTLYGVWFKADNKSAIWYDIGVFESQNITAPTTWDELISTSQSLVDDGFAPFAIAGADGWTLSDLFEDVYARTAGPELYGQLLAHEIPWTHESVQEALAVISELVHQPDFVAEGIDGALQMGFVDAVVSVGSGEAVMVKGQAAVAGIAEEEAGAVVGTDINYFTFPSIEGSPSTALGSADVAVALTDNPGAMALLEFLTTPEAMEGWVAAGGVISPNLNLDLSLYPDDVIRGLADGLLSADVFVFDMSDTIGAPLGATAGSGIWGGLQNWLEDPSDVDAILAQIEQEAQAHFGE